MQLSSVRAVITGGVSGLGLAVAQHLIAQGGKVALFDLNDDKAQPPLPDWVPTRPAISTSTSAMRRPWPTPSTRPTISSVA